MGFAIKFEEQTQSFPTIVVVANLTIDKLTVSNKAPYGN